MARVVLVHGFTQTPDDWPDVFPGEVVKLALPGHDGAPSEVDLWGAAALIGVAGGEAAYVGYSMGGRVALHLALLRPDVVDRVVLVGVTAGIDDPEERNARRRADEALARSIEVEGVDAFLVRWLDQPMFAGLPAEAAGIEGRRRHGAAQLASALRTLGTGTQEPLWSRLGELDMPVLLVAGGLDLKFAAMADRMAAAIGANATVALVPDAGHACHLEDPDAFGAVVQPFLTASG